MTSADIRSHLEEMVLADIIGPAAGESEALPKKAVRRVRDHYLVGMLAPREVARPAETNEPVGVAGTTRDDDGPDDEGAPATGGYFPSSMGFTAAVEPSTMELLVEARWGHYTSEDAGEAYEGEPAKKWQREPRGGEVVVRLADEGDVPAAIPDPEHVQVVVRGRWKDVGGVRLVTLFIINDQLAPDQNKDEAWLFQVVLSARAVDGSPVFVGRPTIVGSSNNGSGPDAESRTLDMLYRRQVEFAVGHGVGVHVDVVPGDPGRATYISTVVVPAYDVQRTEAPSVEELPSLAGLVLDMKVIAEATNSSLPSLLMPLLAAYAGWIEEQQSRIDGREEDLEPYRPEARATIKAASDTLKRLDAGIALLATDAIAAKAFQFANRAMWQQRVHSTVSLRRAANPSLPLADALADADVPRERSWRVFQLAFILINLPGLTNPTHADRDIVDLLFFPTGGGKTEAYLGLTAYTLAMRRLQETVAGYDGGDGVAVLMRYTLRLLTSQQFQRAAALICACELIRAEGAAVGDASYGTTPFRIGMWVGGAVTPNREKDARIAVRTAKKMAGKKSGTAASPLQLRNCPWCGAPLEEHEDLQVNDELRRTLTFCGDELGTCPFTEAQSPQEGLPLVTVDETIYRLLPSLIIATVDKFAQLPWRGATRNLFGRADRYCERHGWRDADEDRRVGEKDHHIRAGSFPPAQTIARGLLRPPDLIIQDELHLISGSLGTLIGLYESAIDEMCSWEIEGKRVRPKVVASTATVRRAREQALQLFWRDLAVFPPPVLDVGDSFFARQRSEGAGRRYLGICARGQRLKAVEIRMFVALMGAAQRLFNEYGVAVDPYMTLVGYFSAVRELAGMRRLVDDDIRSRLARADQIGLARRYLYIGSVVELTSRAGSGELPLALQRLSLTHRPDRAKDDPRPVDVLLATNMISVGVDVPRLGLMVVAGQPKATAEYIQATSRVGRDHDNAPGLIYTVYNWSRPRDLSHYETFEQYHATFYKHVEGLSVTPFAPRALDRGLTAVVTSLLRHDRSEWNPNLGAQRVDVQSDDVRAIKDRLVERALALTSDPSVGEEVAIKVQQRLEDWAQRRANVPLSYDESDGQHLALLQHPGVRDWDNWTCPNSLRETEPNVNVLLEYGDWSLEDAPPFDFGDDAQDGDDAEPEAEAREAAEVDS